jgi:O-antigen ligase
MKNLYKNFILVDNFRSKITIIFVCLVPFSLSLGPLLPELFLLISCIILSSDIYKLRNKYFNNTSFFLFLIFYTYILSNSVIQNLLVNVIFNIDAYNINLEILKDYFFDQKSIIFFFRFFFYFVLLWYLFDQFEIFKKLFFLIIFLSISLIGIDALLQYFSGYNLLGYTRTNQHRLSGIFKDEYILGSFFLKTYFIFLSLFVFYKDLREKKNELIYILINCFFGILIFLSGERSAFFLFIFALILSFILLNQIKFRFMLKFILLFIIIITSISILDGNIRDRIFKNTLEQFTNKDKSELYIFTEVHHGHYMSAKLMLRENPFFGVGPKNFKIKCKERQYKHYKARCEIHPHNYYVQLFSELGFFGGIFLLLIFLVIFFKLFKIFIKNDKEKDSITILLIALFIFLWPIVPHGNFFNNWNIIQIIMSFSFYKHLSYK